MGRTLRWWTASALVSMCTLLPAGAQPAGPSPAPAADADGMDVALPHLSRLNGPGAVVQRDVDEVPAVAGEPLAFGDRVTTGDAQVQIVWSDGSLVSLDRRASIAVLAPDLLALTAGRALVVTPRQATEPMRLDTPAGTVIVSPATEVRLSVTDAVAELQVVHGAADVRHIEGRHRVEAGHRVSFRDGLAPSAPQAFNTAAFDTFVEWAREPVVALERSPSREHLDDPRLEAYSDVFDRYGQWQADASYGHVWYPQVGLDWRPYSDGYWQPFGGAYGPTWVALDPWGWPTHHYGVWDVNPGGRWFWRPGRRWSPGRVVWSVGPGYVGWSPLDPRGNRWSWDVLASPARASQRGVYASGTLDPFRAWTVIPTERYGMRHGLAPYAVDARTLPNLGAFVTQRVAPPLRYGGYGGYGVTVPGRPGGGHPGSYPGGYPGRASGRGYGSRTGDDTNTDLRRGIPPTRVNPPAPGPYVTPPPAPRDDPYERARGVAAPRAGTRAGSRTPPPPAADSARPRQRHPQAEAPAESAPRRTPPPAPPAEAPPPAAAPAQEAPPSRGLASPRRAPESAPERRAVPRPPA